MFLAYSLLLTVAFVFLLPIFILRREKYASGFRQRLGNYPEFEHDEREVIWLHCVSVGETNAARPLVDKLSRAFPNHRLIVSTTTKTGQELARNVFAEYADAVFYFPLDWKFSVRRALKRFRPSVVLLMETEIWPRFIHEANASGAKIAIINGRLSQKSFRGYAKARSFVRRVLAEIDQAVMQGTSDADRLIALGISASKVTVVGNLKFELDQVEIDPSRAIEFRERFKISERIPLMIAASTHKNEEQWVLDALEIIGGDARLMIAPRHPERFDEVAELVKASGYTMVRRSSERSENDGSAEVILLDSIGELRDIYSLAEIVFVGGSLIPHGGQSVLEPAAAGKAIITGHYTHNFEAVIREFRENDALIQLPAAPNESETQMELSDAFLTLLTDKHKRKRMGNNAAAVMKANRGAAVKTLKLLRPLLVSSKHRKSGN